jgi:NADPH:quinone reductase-like Zn-dependent oxidoreductase
VVFDYHDPGWPARVRDASPGGRGVGAAVNAARGGAATALQAVAAGGRLATITGDPPRPERGVAVTDVYVRADGARLAALVTALAEGPLSLHVAATLPLADAGRALQGVVAGHVAGASVLMLNEAGSRRQSTLLAASRRRSVSPADAVEGAVRLAATR